MLYQHLLIAVDLTDDCHKVIERAAALTAGSAARLSLVHVLEPISTVVFTNVVGDEVNMKAMHQAQLDKASQKVAEFRSRHPQLAAEDCHVLFGHVAQEVHRVAYEHGCDLIVTGSHGRHGLALLRGSTSNDLLHGATCDVLAVYLPKP